MENERGDSSYQFSEVEEPTNHLVAQISQIETQAFGEGGMNPWFLVPFIRHGRVFIFTKDAQAVAVAEYMRDFADPTVAYLFGLAVETNHRRRGLAKRLLHASHQVLQESGIVRIRLTVSRENHTAYRLYQIRLGFRPYAFLPEEYGPGEDRIAMELQLG